MKSTPREEKIRQLCEEIAADYTYANRFTGLPTPDPRVLAALAEVPREEFVPPEMRRHAYENRPLPIGNQQTISQPYIVALMTDLLLPREDAIILEIGTGSGYQSAILSRLVKKVYSVEIIASLAEQARKTLAHLGYHNIEIRVSDGRRGWPEHAPYDGIIVTAAAPEIPTALIAQLKPHARLVIPVRVNSFSQELLLVEKGEGEKITTRDLLSVAFVPLTGGDEGESREEP